MYKTQQLIYQKIKNEKIKVFTTSDFLDLGDYKTISKSLELLEDEKIIKRARRGVYYLPRINKTLNIETAPDLNEIAKAIARQYNWNIVPSGSYALNIVGLSTQVSNQLVYLSTGPYNKYTVGKNTIIFKHSTSKEINSLSNNILIAIQAMKAIGINNIKDEDLDKISLFLNDEDKKEIRNKLKTTAWINDKLRRIACTK